MKKFRWACFGFAESVKTVCVVVILLYSGIVFVQQQLKIMHNAVVIQTYKNKINDEKVLSTKLSEELGIIDTNEYIERVARRKLGFVYPSEKVFVSSSD